MNVMPVATGDVPSVTVVMCNVVVITEKCILAGEDPMFPPVKVRLALTVKTAM